MNSTEHREVACAILIDTRGHFLLQQRDDVVGILHPGKVGLFGGHREGDETLLDCVVRELSEELTYFVPPDRFKHLASADGRDIDADIRRVLRDHARLPVDAHAIPKDADLFQAGMSSHASVNVMLALEDAFDVEFPDRMLKRSVFESIGGIAAAIGELQREGR